MVTTSGGPWFSYKTAVDGGDMRAEKVGMRRWRKCVDFGNAPWVVFRVTNLAQANGVGLNKSMM